MQKGIKYQNDRAMAKRKNLLFYAIFYLVFNKNIVPSSANLHKSLKKKRERKKIEWTFQQMQFAAILTVFDISMKNKSAFSPYFKVLYMKRHFCSLICCLTHNFASVDLYQLSGRKAWLCCVTAWSIFSEHYLLMYSLAKRLDIRKYPSLKRYRP